MPPYDFVCRQCGQSFELVINSYLPERDKKCPECRSHDIRQTWLSLFRDGPAPTPGCAPTSSGFG